MPSTQSGKRLTATEALERQKLAWELWQGLSAGDLAAGAAPRILEQLASRLGVKTQAARDILRRECERRSTTGEASDIEIEAILRCLGWKRQHGALDACQRPPRARSRSRSRTERPPTLARVSSDSIYLAGKLVELLGQSGDGSGCVRVRTRDTRGEYLLPKSFLSPL